MPKGKPNPPLNFNVLDRATEWKKIALRLAKSIVNFENDNSADRFPEKILKLSEKLIKGEVKRVS